MTTSSGRKAVKGIDEWHSGLRVGWYGMSMPYQPQGPVCVHYVPTTVPLVSGLTALTHPYPVPLVRPLGHTHSPIMSWPVVITFPHYNS